ncbi:hypothetical protein GF376_03155 [Candidatus Peregrinibacteria bacterium]|nr:hypothetical protein [Candidatus Peregrinibacteria bacterium]
MPENLESNLEGLSLDEFRERILDIGFFKIVETNNDLIDNLEVCFDAFKKYTNAVQAISTQNEIVIMRILNKMGLIFQDSGKKELLLHVSRQRQGLTRELDLFEQENEDLFGSMFTTDPFLHSVLLALYLQITNSIQQLRMLLEFNYDDSDELLEVERKRLQSVRNILSFLKSKMSYLDKKNILDVLGICPFSRLELKNLIDYLINSEKDAFELKGGRLNPKAVDSMLCNILEKRIKNELEYFLTNKISQVNGNKVVVLNQEQLRSRLKELGILELSEDDNNVDITSLNDINNGFHDCSIWQIETDYRVYLLNRDIRSLPEIGGQSKTIEAWNLLMNYMKTGEEFDYLEKMKYLKRIRLLLFPELPAASTTSAKSSA